MSRSLRAYATPYETPVGIRWAARVERPLPEGYGGGTLIESGCFCNADRHYPLHATEAEAVECARKLIAEMHRRARR